MSKNRRTLINIGASRWAAYSAAGIATAVGTQELAEADIFHVTVNQVVKDTNPADGSIGVYASNQLTFGGAGTAYLRLGHVANYVNAGIAFGTMRMVGGATGAFAGQSVNPYVYPANIPYGQFVSALTQFTAGNQFGTLAWNSGYTNSGFLNQGESFLAFRFNVGNGTQFGWARLIMDGSGANPPNSFTLVDYAFGTPGQSIFVGQIAAVPEPGALGVLAIGALGVLAWRRRRPRTGA